MNTCLIYLYLVPCSLQRYWGSLAARWGWRESPPSLPLLWTLGRYQPGVKKKTRLFLNLGEINIKVDHFLSVFPIKKCGDYYIIWSKHTWMKALACMHLESSTVTFSPLGVALKMAWSLNVIDLSMLDRFRALSRLATNTYGSSSACDWVDRGIVALRRSQEGENIDKRDVSLITTLILSVICITQAGSCHVAVCCWPVFKLGYMSTDRM